MYNAFWEKKILAKRLLEEKRIKRLAATSKRNTELRELSLTRTRQWAHNIDPKIAEVLDNGTINLIDASNWQFRDFSPEGNIYIRKYLSIKR